MKVTPVAAPTPTAPQSNGQDARARAIAALTGPSAVPQNQNAVSPEEHVRQSGTTEVTESLNDEASQVVQAEPEVIEEPVSQQHLILARKEKALRAKQMQMDQAAKSREAALAAREAALQAKEEEYKTGYIPKAQLKAQTLQTLEQEGISYDFLTQQMMEQLQPQDPRTQAHIAKLEAQVQKLLESNESTQKNQADQQTQQYQAALTQIRNDVTTLVKSDPNFETIRATGSIGDVVELIEKTYQADGVLMSVEEATQAVEDYLFEEIEKLTKLSKVQKRMVASTTATATKAQTPATPNKQTQPMKTLTNAVGSTRQMSAKERAIAAFKGEKF
jgi:hypothetical protein